MEIIRNHRFLFVLIIGVGVAAAAFFLIRRGGMFGTEDIVLEIRAPEEFDVGAETEVLVTITNSSRRELRDGRISLTFSEGLSLVRTEEETFDTLPSRAAHTAKFRLRAEGEEGTEIHLTGRATYRFGQLSATFSSETEKTIRLRNLPIDVTFSFPADATTEKTMTFFIRMVSRAEAPMGPVGMTLEVPREFTLTRTRPPSLEGREMLLWDFGELTPGAREEVAVTGFFDARAEGGTFIARVGILDATRRAFVSSKEVREFLNLHAGAVPLDLSLNGLENPREVVIYPGDAIDLTIRYQNETNATIEDLSIVLALAHPAINQRSLKATEGFTRSVSGEYVFGPDHISQFREVAPGATGTIGISAKLDSAIPLKQFSDANQSIVVRARAVSGGEILGERQATLKIGGTLAVDADLRYFRAVGGSNRGPLPPRVGEETTYTATITVTSGATSFTDVTVRAILGPSVSYGELIDPSQADVTFNPSTREVVWTIGDLPPGAGQLSAPRILNFRIILKPRPEDVGRMPILLEGITVTGTDTFVGKTVDASAPSIDTRLSGDPLLKSEDAVVLP